MPGCTTVAGMVTHGVMGERLAARSGWCSTGSSQGELGVCLQGSAFMFVCVFLSGACFLSLCLLGLGGCGDALLQLGQPQCAACIVAAWPAAVCSRNGHSSVGRRTPRLAARPPALLPPAHAYSPARLSLPFAAAGKDTSSGEISELDEGEGPTLTVSLVRFPHGTRVHAALIKGMVGSGEGGAGGVREGLLGFGIGCSGEGEVRGFERGAGWVREGPVEGVGRASSLNVVG